MSNPGRHQWVSVPYFDAVFEEGDFVELDEPDGVLHLLTVTGRTVHCPSCAEGTITSPSDRETTCRCSCGWTAVYCGVLPPERRPMRQD